MIPTSRPREAGFSLLRGLLLVLALALTPAALGQGATISQSLQDELAGMSPFQKTTVIVTFNQTTPLQAAQRTLVASTGVSKGLFFEALPIAAVLATPLQVDLLANLPGVLSLWANEPLEYFNEEATKLTGVDRLREDPNLRTAGGLPFTGDGVTVVVNDSGIDATHGDLLYGTHVVENVQAVTNLNALSGLLPVTYIEGTPNTDLNSGHGTHCAGTVGGTGALSNGLYEGVAPGADLVGYGSGAVLFILDGLGGFDYALSHQTAFDNPIRVITNSWGSSADFEPEDPINQASYAAYKSGITVLFAAGNAGSGEDTHNPYARPPWVISVGAGTKAGNLADFSSRGVRGESVSFTTPDGVSWTARNELSVTAPGVDIISARAVTNGGANGGEGDADAIPPEYLLFYTMISGTSMATPHVAGIVALLLEANPALTPAEVKETLQKTATNMPGREPWEAGTGYVNAYAAVSAAFGDARYTGTLLNSRRTFNATANVSVASETDFSIAFVPVGQTEEQTFDVGQDISLVTARAVIEDNLVALVLTDPDGVSYGSAISIPVLGGTVAVTAPGKPGTWTLTVRGIGSRSGLSTDPLGLTNGTSLPGTVSGTLKLLRTDGFTGLSDVGDTHPDAGFIRYAVSERLVDGLGNGTFAPNAALRRHHIAQYLVMGAGVRQYFPTDGSYTYGLTGFAGALAEAVTAQGAPLKDTTQAGSGVMRVQGGVTGRVTRAALAYSFVQALGLDQFTDAYAGVLAVDVDGQRVPLEDAAAIPTAFRGHVQLALELHLMDARIENDGGTVRAYFDPAGNVSRGHYTEVASRFFETYFNGFALPAEARLAALSTAVAEAHSEAGTPAVFRLDPNYPNPFASSTRITYTLPEAGDVRLTVYNVTGQKVAELASGTQEAGLHEVRWDASGLASGAYLYRLQAGRHSATQRMMLVK